jgi:hypothetical protein
MNSHNEIYAEIKTVTITETYLKLGNSVVRIWRFGQTGKWNIEETPFSEVPYSTLPEPVEDK